jgi:hypothetical protein
MNKLFVFISLFILSCSPKNEAPVATEKTDSEVVAKVQSQALQGSAKIETIYELTVTDCRIAWQTSAEKKDPALEVDLRNRTECKLAFAQAAPLYEKVLGRVLKDYAPSTIKSLHTSSLKTLQPDGSWNLIVAKAAEQSADYQDFRKNYPKHKSQKSSNGIFVDLVHQTQVHAPFKEMLAKMNLNFELETVEKVFQSRNDKGEIVIDDAGSFWWRPIQK